MCFFFTLFFSRADFIAKPNSNQEQFSQFPTFHVCDKIDYIEHTYFCDRFHSQISEATKKKVISSMPTDTRVRYTDHIKQIVMVLNFEIFVTNVDLKCTLLLFGQVIYCSLFLWTKRWFICLKCNQINTCLMHTKPN